MPSDKKLRRASKRERGLAESELIAGQIVVEGIVGGELGEGEEELAEESGGTAGEAEGVSGEDHEEVDDEAEPDGEVERGTTEPRGGRRWRWLLSQRKNSSICQRQR